MTLAGRIVLVAAGFLAGFGSGAWLVYRGVERELDDTRGLRAQGIHSELEQRGRAQARALASDAPPPAQVPSAGASTPLDRPPAAAPSPVAAAVSRLMPEPPASWMTVEQQRAAAAEYREWVRDEGRLAGERARGLNAELFMIEGQDPAWAATMESRVRTSMAGSPVFDGAQLESIECRVTVCRATVRFIEADTPRGTLRNGGMSPWSEWRNAQIIPVRAEIGDGVPGFRATVFLGEDFDHARLPQGPRAAGPGGP